ncbi:MAG: phosphatidylserine decarboxylase, partial [Bdellovibrionales bacterium]|nr:phosphatidylserine decarboxylase [Bdellovibrionales bacterium]
MLTLLKYLPKRFISRLTGWLVHLRLPEPLRVKSLEWFANHYKINLQEAEMPLMSYPHIGALFARRLKPGLRRIKGLIVHPVDGTLTERGVITDGMALQVKGYIYSVAELIADAEKARSLEKGHFLTYYLCPTDYHRVHSPLGGQIRSALHVPGTLWPVNEESVQKIKELFLVNERLVIHLDTAQGSVFVVMVGATNVGQMTASFDSSIVTNRGRWSLRKDYSKPIPVQVGDELGIFHMGSTVVVLYPPGVLKDLPVSGSVQWGEAVQ